MDEVSTSRLLALASEKLVILQVKLTFAKLRSLSLRHRSNRDQHFKISTHCIYSSRVLVRVEMSHGLNATIHYLARDMLYRVEKPYYADFEIDHRTGKTTNQIYHSQEVFIRSIMNPSEFNINTHGFCIIEADSVLNVQDIIRRPQQVEEAYFSEIEALLLEKFPEYSRLEGMELVVGTSSIL